MLQRCYDVPTTARKNQATHQAYGDVWHEVLGGDRESKHRGNDQEIAISYCGKCGQKRRHACDLFCVACGSKFD